MKPREVAQEIRPLIGLTQQQALANANYREKVLNAYREQGATYAVASQRADKAAIKYAAKQHRFRAETIVLTENAFAYNRGAHMGVTRAISRGLMGRCAMVWSTAGTNRVCGRCMNLKDTVVGYTDESGVTLPPLHPRCRCVIMYREAGEARLTSPTRNANVTQQIQSTTETNRDEGFQRPATNQGAFSHLKVPMQLRAVKQVCRRYGVDTSGLKIKIQRNEEVLRLLIAGAAAPESVGRIDLLPNAFIDEEQLIRTIIHEGCHVKQFQKYGAAYVQANRLLMERVAERYEEFFWRIVKRRARR